jgi:hypothetical protein
MFLPIWHVVPTIFPYLEGDAHHWFCIADTHFKDTKTKVSNTI